MDNYFPFVWRYIDDLFYLTINTHTNAIITYFDYDWEYVTDNMQLMGGEPYPHTSN